MLLSSSKLPSITRSRRKSRPPLLPIFRGSPEASKQSSKLALGVVLFVALIYCLSAVLPLSSAIPVRGMTQRTIVTTSNFIAPDLANVEALKRGETVMETPVQSLVCSHRSCPRVVLVTDLDYEHYSAQHLAKVLTNRQSYAARHGYGLFAEYVSDYQWKYLNAPEYRAWARLAIMRAAMHAFPAAEYFVFMSQQSVVMDPAVDIERALIAPAALDRLMRRGVPVVSDSAIVKTLRTLAAKRVELVMAQDEHGTTAEVFIMKRGLHAQSLLDFWADPGHRQYANFAKGRAVAEAFNHLIQWHHNFLRRMAYVPSKLLSAIVSDDELPQELRYEPGDFIASIRCPASSPSSSSSSSSSCEDTLNEYYDKSASS
ncbi:hypothetical protein TRVA0_005S02256 [Trichomonascus vanleenenianus]|uniref:uncharacterized protein n=1 Tax=Trichomonascus vanleenenianus TaxID=2268995 RepID=UPI003ECAA450